MLAVLLHVFKVGCGCSSEALSDEALHSNSPKKSREKPPSFLQGQPATTKEKH
jgi:hypothetical protein